MRIFYACVCIFFVWGCVSKGDYDAALKERGILKGEVESLRKRCEELEAERDSLKSKLARAEVRGDELSERAALLVKKLEDCTKENNDLRKLSVRSAAVESALAGRRRDLVGFLSGLFSSGDVAISEKSGGVRVIFGKRFLFGSGTRLRKAVRGEVGRIPEFLERSGEWRVMVIGYAGSSRMGRKLRRRFPSHWEYGAWLSSAVVRALGDSGMPETWARACSSVSPPSVEGCRGGCVVIDMEPLPPLGGGGSVSPANTK